jgi:hypothetical protein
MLLADISRPVNSGVRRLSFMNRFIRKFREGWRSYLLWVAAIAFILCTVTIPALWWGLSQAEANRKYVPELRKLAEQTPIYPGFQKIGEEVVLKQTMVSFFTYYKSDAKFSDIRNFYDHILTKQGWRLSERFGGASGESTIVYRRGDYEITVAQGDWSERYSIVFLWNPE